MTTLGLPSVSWAACTTQSISVEDTKSGILSADDCIDLNANGNTYYYDYYQFSGTSGQQISILNTSSVIDPDLMLIYPDGTFLYDDDSGGGTNARIPVSGLLTLPATGTYSIVASSSVQRQTGAYTLVLSGGASSRKTAFEFYNTTLKHYFITTDPAEAAGIDNGAGGAGWVRTGFTFNIWGTQADAPAGALPVCRFYGSVSPGPNSHFYTLSPNECAGLKQLQATTPATQPRWNYEGISFYSMTPVGGVCPPTASTPIYRVYNDGFAQGKDSNHRLISSDQVYQQMADQGWIQEGVRMCTTGATAPIGVSGGMFSDSSGTASVSVSPGEIPPYVHATAPSMTAVSQLPAGLDINTTSGDANITMGAPGYVFILTGDSGFVTNTAGAVKISLPFSTTGIAAGDLSSTIKIFVRLFNPDDNSIVDLSGDDISIVGATGKVTVETRGLPKQFTAVVIYNPNMDSATSDDAAPDAHSFSHAFAAIPVKTTWPAQSWCVIYNPANPNLIAAVKNVHGLAGNPGAALIRSDIVNLVGGSARKSQTIYQADGMNGPNLYIGRACPDRVPRYNIHMIDGGSKFQPNDPGEVISSGTDHYGRLYVDNARLDDGINTVLGTVLASVSHEMLHGVQNGYEILGATPKGYREGSAATYGKSIDNGQVIRVRNETESLGQSLMTTANAYGNEDFFAYVGKQYNAGSLNYLSGLYAQMRATIGAKVYNPSAATMYGAMDTYFKAAFSQSLQAIYLDFLKQRGLTHNAASQFGRTGEVVAGFAEGLFGAASVYKQNLDLATCSKNKISLQWNGLASFATGAIVINPTGVLPAGSSNPSLIFKITPASSSVGALWNGFTYRAGTASALAASNKFPTFGKQAGDQVVILVSNLDPANAGTFGFEISCAGPTIDSISPVKGPVDTSVTITGSGFGTASDTRAVTFNGVTAATVTFNSDTQAVAKVPQNASTGDVIVTVNGDNSNGVNFEVVAQCSATQNSGADTPDTRTIELGKTAGAFAFNYETFTQQDRIIVKYLGSTLFDSGCVGTDGTRTTTLNYGGSSSQIVVQVIPNCAGGTGTLWNYSVGCPK